MSVEFRYANYFAVGHGPGEVVLEFGQAHEGGESNVHTRIVTTPNGAMDLLRLLKESLAQYRATYGGTEIGGLDE